MSGGSFDYGYATVENLYSGRMEDDELNDLILDLVEVLHDLEWWQSCDTGEDSYRKTVRKFKRKWFKDGDTRLKKRTIKKLERVIKEIKKS